LAVDDLPVALAVIDDSGIIAAVAPPFAELVGHERDELVGRGLRSLVAPDDRAALDQALADGDGSSLRVAGRRSDGLFFVADLTVGRLAGGTARVVTAAAGPANPLTEGDPAIDRETRGVVDSALSHDVRGPLRGVNGFLAIFDREADAVPEKLQGFLDTARRSALTADTMADQLVRYIRVGRRPFAVRTVDLRDVVVEAAEQRDEAGAADPHGATDGGHERELGDDAPSTGVLDVEVGDLAPVVGNRSLLLECVTELLANAAKFGATRVVVSGEPSEGWLYVRVADDGPGVDPELADDAFRLFRLLQPKGRFPGVGAGLAVARQIAEVHGGGLWIEPSDAGTTVVLRLLLAE
jgi:PAS domain S-box-containing protein